jgi:hypothetical protein
LWVIIRSAINESTRGDALKPAVEDAEAPGAGEADEPKRDFTGDTLPPGGLVLPPGELAGDLIAATARMANSCEFQISQKGSQKRMRFPFAISAARKCVLNVRFDRPPVLTVAGGAIGEAVVIF